MPQVVAVAAAWVAKTLTVKAVAAFVVKTALQAVASIALSKAAKALGLSKQSIQERQASVTSLSLGEGPREAAFGVVCTGGTLLDAFNFGGKYGTDTVTRIIALADHLVDAIVGYYVDDVYYAWTGDGVQPGFNGKLSIEFKNGVAGGNVPPLHVRQHGGWTVNDVLAGVTHVVVDTRYDDAVWTSGHPRFKFVLRGLRVYDPRRDPALGYTGPNPQTWEDTSTHGFSRNAALNRYAYERGIYAAGHQGEAQHLLIGRGLTAEEAPPSRVIAAANLCDELVGGEMRYAAEGVIFANQSFDEVEELFAAAMAGVLVQREGGLEIEPGQAKAAVVTITDGDLVGGKPMGMSPFLPDSDGGRVNTIVPRYIEPSQGWLDHAAPVIRDLSRMAPAPDGDGGPREMTLALALVTVGNQANRNGAIALRKAALERRATITLPPKFAGIEEGDWIAWTSARRFGGATVRFRVVSFSLDAGWQNSLVLEEIASSVYGVPDPVEDLVLPPPAPVPVDALQLLGVTAEAITLAGETSTLPAVRFEWDVEVEDTSITGIRAEIRKAGQTDTATTRIDDVAKGQAVVTGGVWPDSVLECRLVPLGDPTRPVLTSNWITVNTTAVTAGISDDLKQEIIDEATQDLDDKIEEAKDQIEQAIDLDGLFGGQDDLAESILKLGREALSIRQLMDQMTRDGGVPVKVVLQQSVETLEEADRVEGEARTLLAAELGEGLSVAEQSISVLVTDLASEANSRAALAVTVGQNQSAAENSINAVATNLSAEVTARQQLGVRVGSAEGAITSEASVRANQDGVHTQNFTLMGARRGDNSGWVLNKSTVDLTGEGSFATVLSGLRAVDGANASDIITLQSASGTQASQLTSLSLTVGGQATSISQLLSVTEGLGARYTLSLDGDGAATQFIADGQTRSIIFKAASLTITDDGNGLSYQPATGRLKMVKGALKTILGVSSNLILWSGSTAVADGSETYDNGTLGIGSDGAYFGGQTLSDPFDSGAGSSTEIALTTSYQTVATVSSKHVLQGNFAFWPEFFANGAGQLMNAETNNYRMEIAWQVVSTDQSGGDAEVLEAGSHVRSQTGSGIFASVQYTRDLTPGMSVAGTKSGNRKLLFQARSVYGSPVFVSLARLRGFYAA